MALNPNALTDLVTVKEHLNINPSNTDLDNVLERFINAVSTRFETLTDRKLKQVALTEFQDGRQTVSIVLKQWPADKPSELWIDSTSDFTDSAKQLTSDEYELELNSSGDGYGVILTDYKKFPRGRRNIKVVYNGGYATVPPDLADACIWAVEYMFDMRSDRRIGTESKEKNQETTKFLSNLPPFVMDVVDRYRRMDFPSAPINTEAR